MYKHLLVVGISIFFHCCKNRGEDKSFIQTSPDHTDTIFIESLFSLPDQENLNFLFDGLDSLRFKPKFEIRSRLHVRLFPVMEHTILKINGTGNDPLYINYKEHPNPREFKQVFLNEPFEIFNSSYVEIQGLTQSHTLSEIEVYDNQLNKLKVSFPIIIEGNLQLEDHPYQILDSMDQSILFDGNPITSLLFDPGKSNTLRFSVKSPVTITGIKISPIPFQTQYSNILEASITDYIPNNSQTLTFQGFKPFTVRFDHPNPEKNFAIYSFRITPKEKSNFTLSEVLLLSENRALKLNPGSKKQRLQQEALQKVTDFLPGHIKKTAGDPSEASEFRLQFLPEQSFYFYRISVPPAMETNGYGKFEEIKADTASFIRLYGLKFNNLRGEATTDMQYFDEWVPFE